MFSQWPAFSDVQERQRGAALILALLVLMIVSLLVTSVSSDALVTFRRVENQLHSQQAYAYLLAAETVARRFLLEDIALDARSSKTDSESEQWAAAGLNFLTEQGEIRGHLRDLAGRLNLSRLGYPAGKGRSYSVDQQRFIRLLQAVELEHPLDLSSAEQLANAVFDWVDEDDNERSPAGAESHYYRSADFPGRAANQAAVSISELRWVKGITPEIYQALTPHISALPYNYNTLNINTASLEVLRSLNKNNELQPLPMDDAQIIIGLRESEGALADLSIFGNQSLISRQIDTRGLGLRSDYFLLTSKTEYLSREFSLQSVIFRNSVRQTVTVVARTQAGL